MTSDLYLMNPLSLLRTPLSWPSAIVSHLLVLLKLMFRFVTFAVVVALIWHGFELIRRRWTNARTQPPF